MKKAQIFYYSGTGNSLFAAGKLSENIAESTIVPMVSVVGTDFDSLETQVVGLVFPVYAFSLPHVVQKFLKELKLRPDTYVFAVATRGGSCCKVFDEVESILKKKGASLQARFFLNMPNNYLTVFPIPSGREIETLTQEASGQLEMIATVVNSRRKFEEKDPHYNFFEKHIFFPILTRLFVFTNHFNMEKKFYSDEKCNGCALCSRVCLSGKISVRDGKPSWSQDIACYNCLACLHYCPSQAIQLKGGKTNSVGRYHHPSVNAADIACQKKKILPKP